MEMGVVVLPVGMLMMYCLIDTGRKLKISFCIFISQQIVYFNSQNVYLLVKFEL